MKQYSFLLMCLFVTLATHGAPLDVETFAKKAEYTSVKLSPNGKFLAATAPYKDQTVLAILERKNMSLKHVVRMRSNQHIGWYAWANDERIVFTRNFMVGWAEQPRNDGQIFATNVDGSKESIIYGYQSGGSQTGTRINRNRAPERAHAEVLHLLPDEPDHILISSRHWDSNYDSPVKLYKLNIYTQRRKLITRSPFGNMNFLLTPDGAPFMAYGIDRKGLGRSFFYKGRKWLEIGETSPIRNMIPLAYYPEKSQILLEGEPDGGTDALYTYNMKKESLTKIFQDPVSDILDYIRDPLSKDIVGVELMPGKVKYEYTAPKHTFAKLHKSLSKAFAGHSIDITSQTRDSSELIIYARSDKNPGDFFIFDRVNKKAEYILSTKKWIDPEQMSAQQPIQFKNRNGDVIHGYLTLPRDSKTIAKSKVISASKGKFPLVVNVHGGPFGVRDYWWFDRDAQLLANNGYAVLQVNYRGSGGYGESFESDAYRKRSTMIQHDIIDGTRWALSQDSIDDSKVCIMGWSFGGYSAVMAPLTEPDLFKCSIAAAGVYDAAEQLETADYTKIASTNAQAEEVYGNDEKLLKSESPITYIDKLKVPVFIVHGGEDERVPPVQAEILREALDDRKMPYEWMFKDKEGHGFYNEKNQAEFYQRSLVFLDKYLK